jgi:hypothetical protein
VVFTAAGHNFQHNLQDLLPAAGELDGWSASGEARAAAGKDLYLLIDGGAEIYYEFGFKQVIFQTYSHANGQTINLELYEMDNPQAAYGVYTFKTGRTGIALEIGQESWLESYFLNSWRGNYLTTVIGLNDDTLTMEGIKKIAGIIDSKINCISPYPYLVSYLPRENLKVNDILYLKGNLALFNYYLFSSANIFGLREGVIGEYTDHALFIFRYTDQTDAEKWYNGAKNYLKTSERFRDYTETDSTFSLSDTKNKMLRFKNFHEWIWIILSDDRVDAERIFNSVQSRLYLKN